MFLAPHANDYLDMEIFKTAQNDRIQPHSRFMKHRSSFMLQYTIIFVHVQSLYEPLYDCLFEHRKSTHAPEMQRLCSRPTWSKQCLRPHVKSVSSLSTSDSSTVLHAVCFRKGKNGVRGRWEMWSLYGSVNVIPYAIYISFSRDKFLFEKLLIKIAE